MSQPSSLDISLQKAIADRAKRGTPIPCLDEPLPSSAPDFFSNDYLSLCTDRVLRDNFLRKVQTTPRGRLLGSTGPRLATGNSTEFNALERAFQHFFGSSSAFLLGSGFIANFAFFASVPQKDDVIVYDELIHTSCREGIRMASRASYRFAHNSVASFEECLHGVLQEHPQLSRGTSTVFIAVESLYSMDGDFCPLTEIVGVVEALVPTGHAHIVVDEAHTSGICGANGTGYVSHLGLDDRVHTKVHSFGKAWGFHGAVILTSPSTRDYLINFAKCFIFSTSMPYTDIYALESCLGIISGARGKELRRQLNRLSRYAHHELFAALKHIPETILTLNHTTAAAAGASDHDDPCSPIFPLLTPCAESLADSLLQKGYAVSPITYPIVRRSRIRVTIHVGNTEAEIDAFVGEVVAWAATAMRRSEALPMPVSTANIGGGAEARASEGASHVTVARAIL